MAGIIVDISIFLVIGAVLLIIKLKAKSERKVLRHFYDILFLSRFFIELKSRNLIKDLLRDGETIFITRKILMNHKSKKSSEGIFDKKGNICYIFKIHDETFEICDSLHQKHKRLLPLFFNTKFELKIKKNKIDIALDDHFGDFICVTSEKTIVQSICILLESICEELKEEYFFFCSEEEVEATEKIVEKTKEVLLGKIRR